MQLIPAIDLRRGRVVRLVRGDDRQRTTYEADPERQLARFGEAGIGLVHVVDLDGAFGEPPQRDLIARLAGAAATGGPAIEVGGGLRDRDAVAWALDTGCARVVVGSMAVRDPEAFRRLVASFPGRVLPAIEVAGGRLKIAGWRESADIGIEAFARDLRGLDCPAVLVTDVERDGMLGGPNLSLAQDVARWSGLPSLLSGGVHTLGDLEAAAKVPEIIGAIVGKALYDGVFSLADALTACEAARETIV